MWHAVRFWTIIYILHLDQLTSCLSRKPNLSMVVIKLGGFLIRLVTSATLSNPLKRQSVSAICYYHKNQKIVKTGTFLLLFFAHILFCQWVLTAKHFNEIIFILTILGYHITLLFQSPPLAPISRQQPFLNLGPLLSSDIDTIIMRQKYWKDRKIM